MITDYFGQEVKTGDIVAYVVRRGSSHWVRNGTIDSIDYENKLAKIVRFVRIPFYIIRTKNGQIYDYYQKCNKDGTPYYEYVKRQVTIGLNREDLFKCPEGFTPSFVTSSSKVEYINE